jgi:hypothetical protein
MPESPPGSYTGMLSLECANIFCLCNAVLLWESESNMIGPNQFSTPSFSFCFSTASIFWRKLYVAARILESGTHEHPGTVE